LIRTSFKPFVDTSTYIAYVEGIEIKAVKDPEEDIINKARSLAIYLARDLSGVTCNELGDFFGGVSGAAITVRYNKITEEMAEDKRLKRKVSKIKARLINI
jgi:chromosomal replication initiation ATPase DnaA